MLPDIDVEIEETPIGTGLKASKFKRPIDTEAKKIKSATDLPPSPGDEITDREWLPWAKLLTESMWNKVSLYFYRLKPKIIRQLSDTKNKNYIDKLGKCIDIREYLLKMHGGGKYRVEVVGTPGKDRRITCVIVDIPIEEADPILDYNELDLTHSDNLGYVSLLRNKGIIDDRGKPVKSNEPAVIAPAVTGNDMVMMMREFMKMSADQQAAALARASSNNDGIGSQVGTILLEQIKQNNPGTMLAQFGALKDLFVKQGGGAESILPLFMTMMENQNKAADRAMEQQRQHSKEMIELLKEVKTGRGGGGGDDLGTIDRVLGLVTKVDELRGGGGAKSAWELGLDYAKEFLPLLQPLAQIAAMRWGGAAPGPQPGAQPNKPVVPNGKQITASELARQNAAAAQNEKPAVYRGEPVAPAPLPNGVATEAIPEVLPAINPELHQVLSEAGNFIVEFMKTDRDGVELATTLINLYTKVAHARIAKFGVDGIMDGIRNYPELAEATIGVYGEAKVKQFVDEFVDYENYLGDDNEDEVVDIPEPKKGRTAKK